MLRKSSSCKLGLNDWITFVPESLVHLTVAFQAHGTIEEQKEIEKEILLSNIQTLADKTQEVHVTTDGSFLILADQLNL
ncbi:hypothetical protein LSAT2_032779 [Lamellibrachia satsuma]|nr:hypothetical protein LSAT2_032779 [Lamellibrachia satsuma]